MIIIIFLRSNRAPDLRSSNLKLVSSGDYADIVDNSNQQFVYEVTSSENMTLTFSSDTEIYGIGVTNIKKTSLHPVGGIGWATESRDVDIDHTLTGYYTKHNLKTFEVKYDSYDLNTATAMLTEIKNTGSQPDGYNGTFIDHGYIAKGNGIVLREEQSSNATAYNIPLFVPAVTTTHPVAISGQNMMRPNLVRKTYFLETETENGTNYTRFLLTNVHWTYVSTHALGTDEQGMVQYADAAGFYRMHIWETTADMYAKNTMGGNTAYLLVPTANMPVAVWSQQSGTPSRQGSIGIREGDGVQEMLSLDERCNYMETDSSNGHSVWYTLNGIRLSGKPQKAGIYLRNGRKVMVE